MMLISPFTEQRRPARNVPSCFFRRCRSPSTTIGRLDLDLRRLFELYQFFLQYQPIVDLATGAFTGAEALLRWRHPQRGVLEPSEFISGP